MSGESVVDGRLVAYHEAGHAVLATVLGFEADVIRLDAAQMMGQKLGTKTEYKGVEPKSAESKVESLLNRATYLFGGRLAEMRGTGNCFPPGWTADDLQIDWWYEIMGAVKASECPKKDEFVATIESRADTLVTENWPAIELVAQELLSCDEVTGNRLRQLVATATERQAAVDNTEA